MIDEAVNDTGSKRGKFLIEKRFRKLLVLGGKGIYLIFFRYNLAF